MAKKEENLEALSEVQEPSADVQELSDNSAPKKVRIKLFKDNDKYRDDVFVSVNGENYQIKRGVEVEVPEYIAEVLANSQKQDESTQIKMQLLSEEAAQKKI